MTLLNFVKDKICNPIDNAVSRGLLHSTFCQNMDERVGEMFVQLSEELKKGTPGTDIVRFRQSMPATYKPCANHVTVCDFLVTMNDIDFILELERRTVKKSVIKTTKSAGILAI